MKPWVREIPYLKGAAILAVIAIHTVSYYTAVEPVNLVVISDNAVDVFAEFAVPLFVLASGLALALNYSGPFSKIAFYKRRAATLIPPYVAFSGFYLAYGFWVTGKVPSATRVVFDLLTGNSYYHMWFVPLILQLYLLFPFLVEYYERHLARMRPRLLVAVVVVQMAYSAAIYGYAPIANSPLASNLASRFFLGYIGYFLVGMYVGRNLDSVKTWIASLPTLPIVGADLAFTCVISAIWIQGNRIYGGESAIPPSFLVPVAVLQPILYFGTFPILIRWSSKTESTAFRFFGEYSLWIYLVHPIFILTVVEALSGVGITYASWLFYPVVFGATCGLSVASALALGRLPYNGLLGGPRRWGPRKDPHS